jgi:SIR2-like domain
MTFSDVKKACIEKFSLKSFTSLLSPQAVDDAFNEFFGDLVSEEERAPVLDYLFHGMDAIEPSDGYKLLVLLAKAGIIDSIVTTNFDNLLEKAQCELDLDVFQIYAAGVASPYVSGNQLFLPPRPVYIKLHGDIKAKCITHLTEREIREKPYDRAFSLMLQSILKTHTLIFIGYSGGDHVFANELRKASAKIHRPIYWCNVAPLDDKSPCAPVILRGAVTSVGATFEQLLGEAGAYPLRKSTVLESKPHFLLPLIKDRVKFVNEQFISSYAYKDDSVRFSLLQNRHSTLDQIASFRHNAEKPLAVLTGHSGVGKTTLLCQLRDAEGPSPSPRLLLLSAQGFASTDFAEELVVRLGYAAFNPLALLYELSAWLRKSGPLLVAVDGLNEFDWASRSCLELFKEILRVALWVQPHNSLKLLITMRPETWDELYSSLDHGDLRKVLWNESEFDDDLRSLHLTKFSLQEMAAAYNSYARHFGVVTHLRQLPDETKRHLTDPYFLALTMRQGGDVDPTRAASRLYGDAFAEILEGSFGRGKAQSVDNSLLRLAATGLNKRTTDFSLEDLETLRLGHEELRVLREIPILRMSDDANYSFAHDRAHEYYLARAISEMALVQVRDWGELTKAVESGRSYPRLASALLQCIVHSPRPKREHYLRLILDGFKARSARSPNPALADDDSVVDFCKEVFFTLAAEQPESFREVVDSYFDRRDPRDDKDLLARLLIRASVLLPLHISLPIFMRARKELAAEAQGEADVLLSDQVTEHLLERPFNEYDAYFNGGPIHDYVFEPGLEEWESALRLLGIITRLGPDNTHPDEWQHLYTCVSNQLDRVFAGYSFSEPSASAMAELVDRHSSAILFNAGPEVRNKFAALLDERSKLKQVFDEIDGGHPLTLEQVFSLRQYVEELDQNIEFVIANLFFVISTKLDRQYTIQLFADYFETFGESTRTEELDFFLSALSLSHLALGYPCHAIVAHYTERMLLCLPQISLGYPGAARGERRALFTDPFEQQFEDGFNPLAFYFYNAPSELRQSMHYGDYAGCAHEGQDPVGLYWKFLEQYERQQNQTGIIRIVHALGQMINLWPLDGLAAVEKLVGRTEPTIRRAIIRVLTEANARFPRETSLMLSRAGSGFTEAEQRQIHWAGDSHMAYRSLEQVHWARVLRFLDRRDTSGRAFNKIGRALVDSKTLPEALGLIMNEVLIGGPA